MCYDRVCGAHTGVDSDDSGVRVGFCNDRVVMGMKGKMVKGMIMKPNVVENCGGKGW